MRNAYRPLLFITLFPLVYIVTAFLLSNIYCNGYSALGLITGQPFKPGGWGQTLKRFRNMERVGNVDLLFMGSSHAYRGFDTRIFNRQGYSAFNMGSSAQTPLNSYYLLKRYFRQLNPKLVIFEVYPVLLSKDGLESFLDLTTNLPVSKEMWEMAFATRDISAVNALVRTTFERMRHPLEQFNQHEVENENYVEGGYCETLAKKNMGHVWNGSSVELSGTQLKYLAQVISYVKSQKADILLVTQPLPGEYLRSIKNYWEISGKIADIARSKGVTYIDYNARLRLDSFSDFYDNDHLTSSGVQKYNDAILRDNAVNWKPRLTGPH